VDPRKLFAATEKKPWVLRRPRFIREAAYNRQGYSRKAILVSEEMLIKSPARETPPSTL